MADDVTIATGECLVACDGRKILMMRNAGTRERPSFKVETEITREDQPDRELASDKPGRMAPSVGPKSAMQETDFHEQEETRFLRELADRLDREVRSGGIESMVIAAAPRALGTLRKHFTPQVRKAVRAEIDSDFVNNPVTDLERHFARNAAS